MPSPPQPEKREILDGVSQVAFRAITEIAKPKESEKPMRRPLESYLGPMFDASIDPSPRKLGDLVRMMRDALIPVQQIAEQYIPTVARRLGVAWSDDRLDFAKVSIGSARLQGLLRQLDGDWNDRPFVLGAGGSSILVGVPEGMQHTMGACLLAGQLRHKGFSVHLDLALTPEAIAEEMALSRFIGVLLSASGAEYLDPLGALVACSKDMSRNTPVIIGGSILQDFNDICSLTQADLATSDLSVALRYCGTYAANMQMAEPQMRRFAGGAGS